MTQAAKYERNAVRQGYRSGHYARNLTTTSWAVTLHVPRLKGVLFETAIIERYRRQESSVEDALIEMYLRCNLGGDFENVAILVAKMLKAIYAQESKKAAREKAERVIAQLRER